MSAYEANGNSMDPAYPYDPEIRAAAREETSRLLRIEREKEARLLAALKQNSAAMQPQVVAPVGAERPRFHPHTSGEFDGFGEMQFAIDGVLPARGLAVFFGASQAGKSALLLALMRAMVTGSAWFGRETLQRNVWYIALEGQSGLRQRVKAMEKHFQQQLPDAARFIFDEINLMKEDDVEALQARIVEHGGVQVIVIDTLACAMAGGDENSSKDMGKVLSAAKALQQATGGLVILVHHTGKDASRGMRGHSSLFAALDVAIEVKRHENHRTWHLAKARDAEDGVAGAFLLKKVELDPDSKGRPRSSVVVVETEMPAEKPVSREPAYKNQKIVLGLLKEHLSGIEAMADGEPATIAFDQAVDLVKDSIDATRKHQKERAQDAIRGLIKGAYLSEQDGVLSLPGEQETDG